MIYMSSQLAEVNPIVFNSPFEDFEAHQSPHGPCKVIKVTEEVRRLDQAARDEKLPADWLKFRATLSESNLRMARQERAGAGRVQENHHRVLPCGKRVRLSGRYCGCGKPLSYSTEGDKCVSCLLQYRKANRKPPTRADRVPCDLCPRLLRAGRKGMCHVCKDKNRSAR